MMTLTTMTMIMTMSQILEEDRQEQNNQLLPLLPKLFQELPDEADDDPHHCDADDDN